MSSERKRSPEDPPRRTPAGRHETPDHSGLHESPETDGPRSAVVPVDDNDDPLVRALVGQDRESVPPRGEPRELSPESLAILLDRLDGIVEDNDAGPDRGSDLAPAGPGRSGVMRRGRRHLGLPTGLAIAAGLLAASVTVLLWPGPPAQRGRVERHAVDGGWAPHVQTVDLPAAPETSQEAPSASEPVSPGAEPASDPARVSKGTVHVRSESSAAQVFLRGRSLGRVPGALHVPPGRHHLLFRTSEGPSFYRTVRVRAGETVELTLP